MPIRAIRGKLPPGGNATAVMGRLVCFPWAGSGAAVFRQWPDYLPSTVELCLPCLPGRDARVDEPPATDITRLIDSLADGLFALLDRPYSLFGHSMGAFIAFDLAHELSRRGRPPEHLFVSAQRGPSLPYRWPKIFHLPDEEFLSIVSGRYNNIPKPVLEDKAFREILIRTLRGDFTLTEEYRYQARGPLRCPITAFGGTEDGLITPGDLEVWALETKACFQLHMMPGGHFFLNHSREELILKIRASGGY